MIRVGAVFAAWMAVLTLAAHASAQAVAPLPVGGPAQAAVRQLHPPAPLDQVYEQSMSRSPALPLPAPPTTEWVGERRVFSPELGREVVVPGHYEQRISDQQSVAPPLTVFDPASGFSFALPGGARSPADSRQGP